MAEDEIKPRRLLELREKAHRVALATLEATLVDLKGAETSQDYEAIFPLIDSVRDDCLSCLALL